MASDISETTDTLVDRFLSFLVRCVEQYKFSAPTVADYCDDLYIRMTHSDKVGTVRLVELMRVRHFIEGGVWLHPNSAANLIYKLESELKRDTTGHAGF